MRYESDTTSISKRHMQTLRCYAFCSYFATHGRRERLHIYLFFFHIVDEPILGLGLRSLAKLPLSWVGGPSSSQVWNCLLDMARAWNLGVGWLNMPHNIPTGFVFFVDILFNCV